MNLSPDRNKVYCHECRRWLNLEQETIVIDYGSNHPDDDHVLCIYDYAHLGFRKDVDKWKQQKEGA